MDLYAVNFPHCFYVLLIVHHSGATDNTSIPSQGATCTAWRARQVMDREWHKKARQTERAAAETARAHKRDRMQQQRATSMDEVERRQLGGQVAGKLNQGCCLG